jgi:hypothetical protein
MVGRLLVDGEANPHAVESFVEVGDDACGAMVPTLPDDSDSHRPGLCRPPQ